MNAPGWLARDRWLLADGWVHGWTTSSGPDFRAAPESAAMAAAMSELGRGAKLAALAWVHQVHGGRVLEAGGPGLAGEADALWTRVPGLAVVGRGADCPLILVGGRCIDGGTVWGFAHASWRSTVAGITTSLLSAMVRAGLQPGGARALICPSAGPCCYEVGAEVRQAALESLSGTAAAWFRPHRDRWLLDLWAANAAALQAAGLPADAIGLTAHCTICGGDRYPSHRRDGARAGRFAAYIAGPAGAPAPG